MELTEQEMQLVEKYRHEAMEKIRRQRLLLKILQVAAEFEAWMQEVGAGATYSTFCDDFDYPAVDGENRPYIYESVLEVIDIAKKRAL